MLIKVSTFQRTINYTLIDKSEGLEQDKEEDERDGCAFTDGVRKARKRLWKGDGYYGYSSSRWQRHVSQGGPIHSWGDAAQSAPNEGTGPENVNGWSTHAYRWHKRQRDAGYCAECCGWTQARKENLVVVSSISQFLFELALVWDSHFSISLHETGISLVNRFVVSLLLIRQIQFFCIKSIDER